MQLRHRALPIIAILALSGAAFAQLDTATITGTVTDTSGALVPAVRITVVQTDTNFRFTSLTNAQGIYRIQSLQPGPYALTFEANGFKRAVREGINLRTGDVLPVNVTLEVGALTESVKVTAEGTLLETETSSSGTVTEGDTLYKMPLYQRAITGSMTVMPGLTTLTTGGTSGLSAYNVGGQRNTGTAMFEDGVFGVDPIANSLTTIKPIENSVEEVKVLTGTLPAEYGHTTSGVITTVKKSGTNEFHGMASDYGRTRRMTHRQFFNLYTASQPQVGNPNGVPSWFMQPDANVSGPVFIPKVYDGRNKTFFFFGYQKLIEKKTQAYTSQTPTPDELHGDFNFGGLGQALYDPLTTRQNPDGTWSRDPFPGKSVPLSRLDPVSAKIIGMNPWRPPNMPGSFSSTGPVSNFTYDPPSRTFYEDYSTRIDQQFSSNFKMYGSYTYNHQNGLEHPTSVQIPAFDGTTGYNTPFTEQNVSVGATYILSPTTLNDARVGFYRARNDTFTPSFGQNWGSQLGIPNISPALMPAFSATALGMGSYTVAPDYAQLYGLTVTGPSRNIRQNLSFRDDFSKIHGSHAFKMGYDVLFFTANYLQIGQPSGIFQFDTMT
ncbi:MAG: carboxypeptidase-like regulatory domain-containing protein, partial [Bryobacteraceae bacterium]